MKDEVTRIKLFVQFIMVIVYVMMYEGTCFVL